LRWVFQVTKGNNEAKPDTTNPIFPGILKQAEQVRTSSQNLVLFGEWSSENREEGQQHILRFAIRGLQIHVDASFASPVSFPALRCQL